MTERKLVKAGSTSLVVSLPKSWVDKNKLSAGMPVAVAEHHDGSIIVTVSERKIEKPLKEITISTDGKTIETIQREITSAYLNNYSKMNIVGKNLGKFSTTIRKIVHDFVAVEITDQTADKITASDLLNKSEVSVDKTLRRMDMTVRSMMIDAFTQPISIRDYDVNRMYFLLNKLLKEAVQDTVAAKELKVNASEILGIWNLCVQIEALADNTIELASLFKTVKTGKEAVKNVHKTLTSKYTQAMTAYFSHNKDAETILQSRTEMMKEISKTPAGVKEILSNMLTNVLNIARSALDK